MLISHIDMMNHENPGMNVQNIGSRTIIRTPNGKFEVSSRGHEVVLFAPDETRRDDPLYDGRDSIEAGNIHGAMRDGVLVAARHYETVLWEQGLARAASDRRFFGLGRISRLFS